MKADNYQRIDIKVSPKLMRATLMLTAICPCGMRAYSDERLGEQVSVEINSVRWARWTCFGCGKVLDVRIADIYPDGPFVGIKWALLDLLDLGAAIPFNAAPKPARWEKVRNNMLPPKGFTNPEVN